MLQVLSYNLFLYQCNTVTLTSSTALTLQCLRRFLQEGLNSGVTAKMTFLTSKLAQKKE